MSKKKFLKLFGIGFALAVLVVLSVSAVAFAADRYLKNTGNWTDTNTWSATDGGVAGVSYPVAVDNVFLTANGNGLTLTVDSAAACAKITASGGCTTTFNGTQTITVGGDVTLLATLTVPNTITFTVTGTGKFAGSTLATLGNINLNGTAHTVSGDFTCANLTRTGTATKTDSVTFEAGSTVTCTGTLTLNGNSATNRLLVQSGTLGSAATLNAAVVSVDAADFMDITGAGAGSWDLSGAANYSGDCGGNTGLTFTVAAAQTWDGTTASWDEAAKWTSRVPLPQDDVSAGGAGNTITVDMPRIGKSITFTGTPTVSLSNQIEIYGSYTVPSGATYTDSQAHRFRGRGSYTITSGGKSLYRTDLWAPSSTYTLQDTAYFSGWLVVHWGSMDFNDQDVSTPIIYNGYDTTRGLKLGNGTFTVNGAAAGAKWIMGGTTGLTFDAEGSTIILTNSGTNAQSFAGGGLTYNHVTVAGTGNYALTVTGNNTFNTFKVDASEAAKTVKFNDGNTQLVSDFTRDYSGNNITINGTGVAGWSLNATAGQPISLDYMTVDYCSADPATTWYMGTHSTDGGNNDADVIFDDPDLTGYITTNAAIGIAMTRDGVTTGLFDGDCTVFRGSARLPISADYGTTIAYGSNEALGDLLASGGALGGAIPVTLTPGATYHYRMKVENNNANSPYYGADETFPLTMTAVTTGTGTYAGGNTVTLPGTVTTMGVASSAYYFTQYGTTSGVYTDTTEDVVAAIGDNTDEVTPPNDAVTLFFRPAMRVGTVYAYGAESSVSIPSGAGGRILDTLLRVVVAAVIVVTVLMLGRSNPTAMMLAAVIGIIAFVIVDQLIQMM